MIYCKKYLIEKKDGFPVNKKIPKFTAIYVTFKSYSWLDFIDLKKKTPKHNFDSFTIHYFLIWICLNVTTRST